MMPTVSFGTAADEAALITAIAAAATTAGWTTYASSTVPAGSTWFTSPGTDGCSWIVGGLVKGTGNNIRTLVGSDIDTTSIVSASTGGYVHNDTAALGSPVQYVGPDGALWFSRTSGSYTYRIVASLDAIAVLLSFTSTTDAQAFIYIGKVEPQTRLFSAQAKALITSVGAGSSGTQRLVTLDRDITAMLKDPADWTGEPAGYAQRLFFQAKATDLANFAQTERIAIVSGTLATSGGVTTFEIDVSTGVKLAAPGRRYASNQGAGDIVRLMSETTVVFSGSSIALVYQPFGTAAGVSFDAYSGQSTSVAARIYNTRGPAYATSEVPVTLTNRYPPSRAYLIHTTNETGKVAQADLQGRKMVGALYHVLWWPNTGQADDTFINLNGSASTRYRVLGNAQLPVPGTGPGTEMIWSIGPGW
jgi:hypothetical protein